MAEENIDPKLSELLSQIEEAEGHATDSEDATAKLESEEDKAEEAEPKPEEEKAKVIAESLDPLDPSDQGGVSDFNSLDEEEDEDFEDDDEDSLAVEAEIVRDSQREDIESKVLGLLEQHCNAASAMFNEADDDRKQADELMALIIPKIENNNYNAADIQSLASLMQTKADIGGNRSRHMDSIAKLFAALKNNDSIGVSGNTGDDNIDKDELEKLLGNKNAGAQA